MQDFAGSTVVHYQGALAGLAGAILLGPRLGKFGSDGKPNAIPGHNMAFTTLGVIILWFGWFGFNPGSTLSVDFGGVGFFAYVALNTNLAAAAGVLGAVVTSWIVVKKPDLSMMLNGAIAALVAITAACAFVAPWAAILIGFVSGIIVVVGLARSSSGSGSTTRSARSPRTACRASGARSRSASSPFRTWRRSSRPGKGGLFYGGGLHQLGTQALGLAAVGAFTFTASFLILLLFKVTFGIRTEPEVEQMGLDVSEHGMWGYPEFYIPVPGGYGTEPARCRLDPDRGHRPKHRRCPTGLNRPGRAGWGSLASPIRPGPGGSGVADGGPRRVSVDGSTAAGERVGMTECSDDEHLLRERRHRRAGRRRRRASRPTRRRSGSTTTGRSTSPSSTPATRRPSSARGPRRS